jgi:signal transduction histidine kinase
MNVLVESTLHILAHQIEARQVQVSIGHLPTVMADQIAMEQIMSNILHNAVIYLDPARPGRIEISSEQDADEIRLSIRDNGRGIAPQDIDKVFAPFRRAGSASVPGEGMGMAYVQALVRRHGGHIRCMSQLDSGTTFTVVIPNRNPGARMISE